MKLNWNFLGGRGVQNKKPSMGGVWIFSRSAQSSKLQIPRLAPEKERGGEGVRLQF